MPPASDYATMRERETAESKEERNAGLVLARVADSRLVAASLPVGMIAVLVFLVVLAVTGLWIRTLVTPDWQEAAAACSVLLAAALILPLLVQMDREAAAGASSSWSRR